MKAILAVFSLMLALAACNATVSDDQSYSFPKGHSVSSNHS
jgi:hypothetical protein